MKTSSRKSDCQLEVRVVPQSSRSQITKDSSGLIKIYLNSPPVDGKANKECIKLLSRFFKVPKSAISLIRGEKNRTKVFSFSDIDTVTLNERLHEL